MEFLPLSRVREVLAAAGIAPRKSLGQNFLVDRNVRDKIVSLAGLSKRDVVIEVGAGLGALTEGLLEEGGDVFAFEVDPGFCRILRARLGGNRRFHLLEKDFLASDAAWWRALAKKAVVISNTPYHLSSQIAAHILRFRRKVARALLTVQREVGERFIACPGSKAYGALTVLLALYTDTRICYALPNQVFFPRPEVASVLVRIQPLSRPRACLKGEQEFSAFLPRIFHCRRKTLVNVARREFAVEKAAFERELRGLGVGSMARVEDLPPETICAVYSLITDLRSRPPASDAPSFRQGD